MMTKPEHRSDNLYLMGIDLGTSSLKTVVMDAGGSILASAAREYPMHTPQPGYAEQNPEDWFDAAIATIREVLQITRLDSAQIKAIGLSGQMHSGTLLDADGKVIRPTIIWADQRSSAQVEAIYADLGRDGLAACTGNPLATGFFLATWWWLKQNEPQTCQRTQTVLFAKDYLRYRLTGRIGTEPSDASASLVFDPLQRQWSRPILERYGIPACCMPPVSESAHIAGSLLPDIAAATGLRDETPVVYGASDQACQALAAAVVEPGCVLIAIGTGGQIIAPTRHPRVDPELRMNLFCHALPEVWHYETAILTAGLSLRWLRDNVFSGSDYTSLAEEASRVPPGAEGLFYLPYLAGERTPHMDPQARACFIGLTLRHSRAHMVRASMEGVVFAMRQGLEIIREQSAHLHQVIAIGGGTRHPLWLQLQADIFNQPIYQTANVEGSAVGAAMLSGLGMGLYTDVSDACQQAVHIKQTVILPDRMHAIQYEAAYQQYCRYYPALLSAR